MENMYNHLKTEIHEAQSELNALSARSSDQTTKDTTTGFSDGPR